MSINKLVFGRKVGSQQEIAETIRFIWGEDTRFTMKMHFCDKCDEEVNGFQIPNLFSKVSETTFCVHCDSILDKPKTWGEHAPGFIDVGILYSDGSFDESFSKDFLQPGRTLKDVQLFHCNKEMSMFDHRNKSSNVEEANFECEDCLLERRLKSFRS